MVDLSGGDASQEPSIAIHDCQKKMFFTFYEHRFVPNSAYGKQTLHLVKRAFRSDSGDVYVIFGTFATTLKTTKK